MKSLIVISAISLAALALAGCAGPMQISSDPIPKLSNQTIVTDLQSAAYDLDSAVTVGALAADDPAPQCLHSVLQKMGIETPAGAAPAATFVPKVDGAASAGAVAYILAQQAKKLANGGVQVDVSCEALLGRVVIDGAKLTAKALPIPGVLKALSTPVSAVMAK
jgi:hypothetical protein